MIRARARLGGGHFELVVEGHQGHEGPRGQVCAAVSAITQTALLGLQEVAAHHPDLVSVEIEEDGS